jgi:diaminohydroxyphosphoribosylaminopyrimidine deaminase/5-amino-6-(5-phosphoribosylamino)uracil reductase
MPRGRLRADRGPFIIGWFMPQPTETAPKELRDADPREVLAWSLVLAAARGAERLAEANRSVTLALGADSELSPVPDGDPEALIAWRPRVGFEILLPPGDPRRALIDLYLPICSATTAAPVTVGHLGQSLDGFIATHAGESNWVTGEQNIRHMHRLRALCGAVVVGPGTVVADDPQLTTRLVAGPNPLRVVLDPGRRLTEHHRVFQDGAAETLYVCARSSTLPDEHRVGRALLVRIDGNADGVDLAQLLRVLHALGCARVFVEGGGVTVSRFLEANLLDRLQITVAPFIIGEGRPAIRLQPPAVLGDCQRPRYRVFRMGGDVLFDCELTTRGDGTQPERHEPIERII